MFNTGIVSTLEATIDRLRYGIINYRPRTFFMPANLIESNSQAWVGLERILLDILNFSKIGRASALEFGVEFGYSTAALSNFFQSVVGVDTFMGDEHAGFYGDIMEGTRIRLKNFENVHLVRSDYRDFIRTNDDRYDLIHVDIVHTYLDTLNCGEWAALHSGCTIFHDTESYPEVKRAVVEVARRTRKKFYNYRKHNGLGILV